MPIRVEMDEVTVRVSNGLEIRLNLATQTACLWRPLLTQPVVLSFNELAEVLAQVLEARKEAR